MVDDSELLVALERLANNRATDQDRKKVEAGFRTGLIIVGSANIGAGRDIRDCPITINHTTLTGSTAEALLGALARLYPPRLHVLPSPPRDFVGRERELGDLLSHIQAGSATISGVRGMGGAGKTALALELARRLTPQYPAADLFLDLRGTSETPVSVRDAQTRVVRAFSPEVRIPDDDGELGDLYRSSMRGIPGLLVLDDARNADQVRPLLPPPEWAVIVTSRRHFDLPGIHRLNLDSLTKQEARALLQQLVDGVSDDDADQIAHLGGRLPLALRLAGGALANRRSLTLAELIRRLSEEDRRIAGLDRSRSLAGEPRGVRASLAVSYELLPTEERTRWAVLSVFPSDFSQDAAAAVWGLIDPAAEVGDAHIIDEATDLLDDLVAVSLVEFDPASSRYRLHDLLRDLAREFFAAYGDKHEAELRHARYFVGILRVADGLHRDGYIQAAIELLEREWPNVASAQSWATSRGGSDSAADHLATTFYEVGSQLLGLQLDPRTTITWLADSLAASERLGHHGEALLARVRLAEALNGVGDHRRAIHHARLALAAARQAGDRAVEGAILGILGIANSLLGMNQRALVLHSRHLAIARERGDLADQGKALGNLGITCDRLKDRDSAARYYEQALPIVEMSGDPLLLGKLLGNLGVLYQVTRKFPHAIAMHQRRGRLSQAIGDRRGVADALCNIAFVYAAMEDWPRAVTYADEALRLLEFLPAQFAEAFREHLGHWRNGRFGPGPPLTW